MDNQQAIITMTKDNISSGTFKYPENNRREFLKKGILLVYDAVKVHLVNGEQFSLDTLNNYPNSKIHAFA